MNEWSIRRLEEVAEFTNGGAWNQGEYVESGIPVARVSDIEGNTINLSDCKFLPVESLAKYRKHILFEGDLIIATVGSHPTHPASVVGKAAVVPASVQGALLNQNAVRIAPLNDNLDKKYLQYLGRSQLFRNYIIKRARGSANQVRISIGALREMEILLPPCLTQHKIATILSAYDDLIENNTRRIRILEDMAQALYREWFVDFRFPGHENVKMVESELGMVPEGWEVVSISDVAIIHRGRSYKGTELADKGGRPFINLKCMERDGGFRSSGLKRYTGQFKDTQTVRAGEMVMAITDMTQERRIIARIGRVSRLDADFGVVSMDLVRVASLGHLSETYLYAMFRWSGFADEVKQHANGANVLHLLPDCIKEHRFVCPTSNIAARFGEIVLPMLSLCDSFELKNKTLRRNRDLLLPKLISGEVDVSSLDIPTGELT